MANRHPVDRLADIRKQTNELKAEGEAIRQQLIRQEVGSKGDEHIARLTNVESRRCNFEIAKALLAPSLYQTIVSVGVNVKLTLDTIKGEASQK